MIYASFDPTLASRGRNTYSIHDKRELRYGAAYEATRTFFLRTALAAPRELPGAPESSLHGVPRSSEEFPGAPREIPGDPGEFLGVPRELLGALRSSQLDFPLAFYFFIILGSARLWIS